MNDAAAPPDTRTRQAEQLADRYLALWNEPGDRSGGHARSARTRRARDAGGNVLAGEVTAVGLVFLVLGADGRIRRDYVFIER